MVRDSGMGGLFILARGTLLFFFVFFRLFPWEFFPKFILFVVTFPFPYIHRFRIFGVRIRRDLFISVPTVFFSMHDFSIVVFLFRMFPCNQCRVI